MEQNSLNKIHIERQDLRWIVPLLMTAGCMILTWLIFGIRYEVNDDATLSNIAAGAYGPQTERLIYINILIGWLLKPLYFLAPQMNWLVFLEIAGMAAALTVLGAQLIRRFGTGKGLCALAAILMLAGVELFNSIQYVKIAGLYLVAGLVLIAENLGKWNSGTYWGIFWVLLGSMVRFQNFMAVGGMSAALLLWHFFSLDTKEKKTAVLTMLAMFALVFGAKGIDYAAYHTDEEWAAYSRYNAVRTELSDFQFQYVTPEDMAEKYGYSHSDFDMILNWNFYDPEVFPVEELEELSASIPPRSLLQSVKETIYTGVHMLWGLPFRLLLTAVLLCWLFFAGKKGRIAFVGTMGLLGVMMLYLFYKGRFPHRVEFVLAFAAAVFGAFCCTPRKKKAMPVQVAAGLSAVIMICSLPCWAGHCNFMHWYRESRLDSPMFYEYSEDKDHLYLADTEAIDLLAGYDVLHPRPENFFSNIVELGGWLSGAPHRLHAMETYGVEIPYRDMTDRDNVYLWDFMKQEQFESFILEHYGRNVYREQIEISHRSILYRVKTK